MRINAVCGGLMVTGALMAGVTPAAGAVSRAEMTQAQAERAYLNAVCPMSDAIAGMLAAMEADDATWGKVRPWVSKTANKQVRAAERMSHPKKAWPSAVSPMMASYTELFLSSAGANYVLAKSGSLEAYEASLKKLQTHLPATLKAQTRAYLHDKRIVMKRLGLPATGACEKR